MTEAHTLAELKPCPWCGEEGEPCDNGRGLIFHVRCKNCRCAGPGERCLIDAITAWNRRPSPPDGEVEKAVLAEREACAELADGFSGSDDLDSFDTGWNGAAKAIGSTIRARSSDTIERLSALKEEG